MPFAENFHPEWGALAPAPSFLRTMRIVLVATVVGATAGAATVMALIDRPASEHKAVQGATAMVTLPTTGPGAITANPVAPSVPETSAASAALNELNSAPVPTPLPVATAASATAAPIRTRAPDKIDMASREGAATPQAAEIPPAPQSPVPAITTAEATTDKAAAPKRHKTVHRRHRIQDASAERRFDRGYGDRGYNTAYRQW